MSDLQTLLDSATVLFNSDGPDLAVEHLLPYVAQYPDNVVFLQTIGNFALELANLELGYNNLLKACELDPNAEQGAEKYLSLGQIIGGRGGVTLLDLGLNKLQQELKNSSGTDERASIVKKLNKGIFSQIEIWMTDLCMEPEAESKCDELIKLSLSLDESNPEAWSLLASIRISQQRREELSELCEKSWDLFYERQKELEEKMEDMSLELADLAQEMLTLSKLCIELELFELSLCPSLAVQEIDDSCVEAYYFELFANYLMIKKRQNNITTENVGEIYESLPPINKSDNEAENELQNARMALTKGLMESQFLDQSLIDEELILQMKKLLAECGGKPTKKEIRAWDDETGDYQELSIASDYGADFYGDE